MKTCRQCRYYKMLNEKEGYCVEERQCIINSRSSDFNVVLTCPRQRYDTEACDLARPRSSSIFPDNDSRRKYAEGLQKGGEIAGEYRIGCGKEKPIYGYAAGNPLHFKSENDERVRFFVFPCDNDEVHTFSKEEHPRIRELRWSPEQNIIQWKDHEGYAFRRDFCAYFEDGALFPWDVHYSNFRFTLKRNHIEMKLVEGGEVIHELVLVR